MTGSERVMLSLTSDLVHMTPTLDKLAWRANSNTDSTPASVTARPMLQTTKISSHSSRNLSVIVLRAKFISWRPANVSFASHFWVDDKRSTYRGDQQGQGLCWGCERSGTTLRSVSLCRWTHLRNHSSTYLIFLINGHFAGFCFEAGSEDSCINLAEHLCCESPDSREAMPEGLASAAQEVRLFRTARSEFSTRKFSSSMRSQNMARKVYRARFAISSISSFSAGSISCWWKWKCR